MIITQSEIIAREILATMSAGNQPRHWDAEEFCHFLRMAMATKTKVTTEAWRQWASDMRYHEDIDDQGFDICETMRQLVVE